MFTRTSLQLSEKSSTSQFPSHVIIAIFPFQIPSSPFFPLGPAHVTWPIPQKWGSKPQFTGSSIRDKTVQVIDKVSKKVKQLNIWKQHVNQLVKFQFIGRPYKAFHTKFVTFEFRLLSRDSAFIPPRHTYHKGLMSEK